AFNQVLLDVFALRVAGAGDELAVGAVAQDKRLAADRAGLAGRLRRLLLLLLRELADRLAGRIFAVAGTGHKHAQGAATQDHDPATVLAVLLALLGFLRLRGVHVGLGGSVLFGEAAAVLLNDDLSFFGRLVSDGFIDRCDERLRIRDLFRVDVVVVDNL